MSDLNKDIIRLEFDYIHHVLLISDKYNLYITSQPDVKYFKLNIIHKYCFRENTIRIYYSNKNFGLFEIEHVILVKIDFNNPDYRTQIDKFLENLENY